MSRILGYLALTIMVAGIWYAEGKSTTYKLIWTSGLVLLAAMVESGTVKHRIEK